MDVLIAQERTNREADLQPILDDLFDSQLWPRELQMSLLSDMQRNYRPSLFSDSVEFLETLQLKGGRVFILSNNPTAPDLAKSFGLDRFMADTSRQSSALGVCPSQTCQCGYISRVSTPMSRRRIPH